ncbi:MAG: PASTA domain-containing protein [Acidimicrobiales bacterium]
MQGSELVDALIRTRVRAVGAAVALAMVVAAAAVSVLAFRPAGAASGEVFLEAADLPGPDAFTVLLAKKLPEISPLALLDLPKLPSGIQSLKGDGPGLYGGTKSNTECDPKQLAQFLAQNPDKAQAWAAAEGIRTDQIPAYVASLTPLVLLSDVRVTNHGYREGKPVPRQAVLQRGTAVLVDRTGVPRVKCGCGNPLAPPVEVKGKVSYKGSPWSGFDRASLRVLEPGAVLREFVVRDLASGQLFARPVGTAGDQDRLAASAKPPSGPVTLPSLEGVAEFAARAQLTGLGLRTSVITEPSAVVAAGLVVRTEPAPGASVPGNSLVTLVVSSGPLGQIVAVPDVAGQGEAEALQLLAARGLTGVSSSEPSATVALGLVIRQDPPAGTSIPSGTVVKLVVSSGPPRGNLPVPAVTGVAETEARAALGAAGFTVTVRSEASDAVPVGVVMRQEPAGGAPAPIGSPVLLVVSVGPADQPVTVPSVVGQAEEAAGVALRRAGLGVAAASESSPSVPRGRVIRQEPAAGAALKAGDTVTIVVSLGPPDVAVTVPDVRGQSEDQASARLREAGLGVAATYQNSTAASAGAVLSQSPTPGTSATAGATVSIVVSLGPPRVLVPSVVGRQQADAEAAVRAAGLEPSIEASPSGEPPGQVIAQDPGGGAEVTVGATVRIIVSTGVQVPDVVNLDRGRAATAIRNAGLVPDPQERTTAVVPRGQVFDQSPPAGTSVSGGSVVTILVSAGVGAPGVVGLAEADAVAQINNAGLVPSVSREASATVPPGVVISQSPAAGAPLSGGATVAIVVSTGRVTVTVPNVVGQTEDQALAALKGVNLVGSVAVREANRAPAGTVFAQTPAGGATADPGATVQLSVSLGPGATVPSVVKELHGPALEILRIAGFTNVQAVVTDEGRSCKERVVDKQDPAPKTVVPTSTLISLYESCPTPPTTSTLLPTSTTLEPTPTTIRRQPDLPGTIG